jgi:hypothetical protein
MDPRFTLSLHQFAPKMTKEQDMYKGELGYTQGFIRLVRNKISQFTQDYLQDILDENFGHLQTPCRQGNHP